MSNRKTKATRKKNIYIVFKLKKEKFNAQNQVKNYKIILKP